MQSNSCNRFALTVATLLFSGAIVAPAWAHGFKDCTKEAKETWKAQTEAEATATAAGYTVSKSKIAGSCYEVYAKDKDGKKFELFYNPVTLELVKKQDD
jgi:hypothetical protein